MHFNFIAFALNFDIGHESVTSRRKLNYLSILKLY